MKIGITDLLFISNRVSKTPSSQVHTESTQETNPRVSQRHFHNRSRWQSGLRTDHLLGESSSTPTTVLSKRAPTQKHWLPKRTYDNWHPTGIDDLDESQRTVHRRVVPADEVVSVITSSQKKVLSPVLKHITLVYINVCPVMEIHKKEHVYPLTKKSPLNLFTIPYV